MARAFRHRNRIGKPTARQTKRSVKKQGRAFGAKGHLFGHSGTVVPRHLRGSTPKAPRRTRNKTLGPKGVRPAGHPFLNSMRAASHHGTPADTRHGKGGATSFHARTGMHHGRAPKGNHPHLIKKPRHV